MPSNHNYLPTTREQTPLTPEQEKAAREERVLRHAHERFGVSLDVVENIERTLALNGFTIIEGLDTPTPLEWIHERMEDQGYAGYNYGTYVQDKNGTIGFAKINYGPENLITTTDENGEAVQKRAGGPKREVEAIETLRANGYDAPAVLGYAPATPEGAAHSSAETYEMVVIEAILPEYGAVRERESWSPELARRAAQKIATFGRPIEKIPEFKDESVPLPVEKLVEELPPADGAYEQRLAEVLEHYGHLDSPIVVHGDTWFNNIIARHDDSSLLFVDWELAGPGYIGQDAGRKLWDLTLTNDWRFNEFTDSAEAFTDEWCKTDDNQQALAFGAMYESLRWISERVRDINDPSTDEATRISLVQEIDDVKAHALLILDGIQKEV